MLNQPLGQRLESDQMNTISALVKLRHGQKVKL